MGRIEYGPIILLCVLLICLVSAQADETIEIAGFTYQLEDGDILYRKGANLLVELIPGPIDHVGIYNGTSGVIESVTVK